MTELTKLLHFLKDGTEQTAKIYTTIEEVGTDYIHIQINGVVGYVPIVALNDSMATKGRVIKNGTPYAIKTQAKPSYTKSTYTTVGTFTFTVPSGVTTLRCEVAGGGGGGGSGGNFRGGAGGGSGYKQFGVLLPVTPYSVIEITVGAGGAGGSNGGNGSDGGASKVSSIVANGGIGGRNGNQGNTISSGGNPGSPGTSDSGGAGGAGGTIGVNDGIGGAGGAGIRKASSTAVAGSPGWVVIEYGGDI